jgi:hypothetical protein
MIVLFNVKITDVRMGYPYKRAPWMPNPERFDVFKYCLSSHAVLAPLVSKFIFCVTLAPELAHRQAELDSYMRKIFPGDKLEVIWQRCDIGSDWKNICDTYLNDPDELVWLACNDDHIFVDSNLDMVSSAIKHLELDPDPNAVMYYSHWPEQMRMANYFNGELTEDGNFIKYQWETFDGIMMLKADRLKRYWLRDYGNALMFKVDYLGAYHGYKCPGTVYSPTKELVRHYEGYSHVNDGMPQTLENIVPPLYIPAGFFGHTGIEIRIGYAERDDNRVNFNPAAEWLYNSKPTGTDYRWVEEDIPLFWKDKVINVRTAPGYDQTANYQARDTAFLLSTHVPMKCFDIEFDFQTRPPQEWFSKHLLSK